MLQKFPTPHINAKPGDFAKTVLMPGDPLRSKFIAENFLLNAKLVNNVRGVQGYTGEYRGEKVSVMASGMGMPSIGIYSYELYNVFGVENILRVGSAGAMSRDVNVRDIVLGIGAATDSNYAANFNLPATVPAVCSYSVLKTCEALAKEKSLPYHVGTLFSSDVFYRDEEDLPKEQRSAAVLAKMGVLAVEMEAAALYLNAMRFKKNALAICTISDHLITGESTTAKERESTFTDMMELALETAIRL